MGERHLVHRTTDNHRSLDPLAGPRRRTTLLKLLALVVGIALFYAARDELKDASRRTPWDLNVDYLVARAYLQRYTPFTAEGAARSGLSKISGLTGFGHPPTTAFWALPLAPFSIRHAGWMLAAVTSALLVLQLFTTLRDLRFPAPKTTTWLAFAFLATSSFMNYHFGVGQWSGFIGFLFFAAWWAARRGRDTLAGCALGAACTLKLFPGVMVVFFVVTRRWRAVLASIAVYVIIAAVMTARFGVASWSKFFGVQKAIADQWMGNVQNQSLHGVVMRLFHPMCLPTAPVISASMTTSLTLSAVLLALACWLAKDTRQDRRRFDLHYGLFVVLSVLTSQWVWEHYLLIYVTPVLILVSEARDSFVAGKQKWASVAVLAAVAAILATWRIDVHLKQHAQNTVLGGRGGLEAHAFLHFIDVLNWAPGLLLLTLLFWACWKHRAPPNGDDGDEACARPADASVTRC